MFARDEGDTLRILCLDEARHRSARPRTTARARCSRATAQATDLTKQAMAFCQAFEDAERRTRLLGDLLTTHDLLEGRQAHHNQPGEGGPVSTLLIDYRTIDAGEARRAARRRVPGTSPQGRADPGDGDDRVEPELAEARGAQRSGTSGRSGPMTPAATGPAGAATPAMLTRRQQVRRDQAERLIAASLQDAALAAPYLCDAMSLSRTSLFRLFAQDGGVANFIRGRRIEAVRDTLVSGPHDRSIKDLAQAWHFADAAHLTRLFKRHYGWPPKRYRTLVVHHGGALQADPARPAKRSEIVGMHPSIGDTVFAPPMVLNTAA